MLAHLSCKKVSRAKTLMQNVLKRQIPPRNFTEAALYPGALCAFNTVIDIEVLKAHKAPGYEAVTEERCIAVKF